MRRRCAAGAIVPRLCGGTALGTSRTWSSACASRSSSATRRCARWMGSNVPPRTPTPPAARRAMRARAARLRLLADLTVATHLVLVRRELAQPHRSARVQAIGADADLGAEAELEAVGEARRRVD